MRFLRIAAAVTTPRRVTRLLRPLAAETAEVVRADRCSIFVWREQALVPVACQHAEGLKARDGQRSFKGLRPCLLEDVPVFARARRERKAVIFSDPAQEPALAPDWRAAFGTRPFVVLPFLQDQRFLGALLLDNGATGRPLSALRVDLGRVIAAQLGLALDHARLAENMRGVILEAETLLNVGTVVASSMEIAETVRRITREAARAVGADSAGIYLARENDRYLEPLAAYHLPKELLEALRHQPLVRSEFDTILDRPRWSDDVPNDPALRHPIFRRFPMRSLLLFPLEVRGRRVGLLVCAWYAERRRPRPEEMRLIQAIAGQAALAIATARHSARAEQAAIGRERMRVDGLLHDTLNSTLFALALKLDWCLQRPDCSGELRAKLEGVMQHTKTMMAQIRGLVTPKVAS